jgi:hypothetical protein
VKIRYTPEGAVGLRLRILFENSRGLEFCPKAVPKYLPTNPALKNFCESKIFNINFYTLSNFLRMPLSAA